VTYLGLDASQDALLRVKTKLYLSIFCQQPRAEIIDSSCATVVPDGSMVRRAALLRYSFRWDSFAGIIHPVWLYGGSSITRHFNPGIGRCWVPSRALPAVTSGGCTFPGVCPLFWSITLPRVSRGSPRHYSRSCLTSPRCLTNSKRRTNHI
jgi:hypothetical protein